MHTLTPRRSAQRPHPRALGVAIESPAEDALPQPECVDGLPIPANHYDEDAIDSLHSLPLALIPLETAGLKRALFVKNARLSTMVELFSEDGAGSGQVEPGKLTGYFDNSAGNLDRDMVLLRRISRIGSFDIYTLRICLRQLDIGFQDFDKLNLSLEKQQELNRYMKVFTRPLIDRIYSGEEQKGDDLDVSDVLSLLDNPDRNQTIRQLQHMADELRISITDVPKFLEDYGDMFLSVSYFRDCLETIARDLESFIPWVDELTTTPAVNGSQRVRTGLLDITRRLAGLAVNVNSKFGAFETETRKFWDNVNADSFRRLQVYITGEHVFLGTVLCSLVVKLQLWRESFPTGGGSPLRRLEFIHSEINPGLEKVSVAIGE